MNENDQQLQLLRRLSNSPYGLSSRDLARGLGIPVTHVNRILLQAQTEGLVKRVGQRWVGNATRRLGPSQIELLPEVQNESPSSETSAGPTRSNLRRQSSAEKSAATEHPRSDVERKVDREKSRWRDFRNLCDYYAECVRLDQQASISAYADEENDYFVSLEGIVPYHKKFRVNLRPSWSPFLRRVAHADYFYLGFPIETYSWTDRENGETRKFINPAFIAPLKATVSDGALLVERIGSIRINDSWLNRRLKKPADRDRFFSHFAGSGVEDDTVESPELAWSDYSRILRQFYQDWCREWIDAGCVGSHPRFPALPKDGIYNRAILLVPKSWKFTASLHLELHKIANNVPDEHLDQTALTQVFPSISKTHNTSIDTEQAPKNLGLAAATPLALNAEQLKALMNATTSALSLIVGPPGTGKSHVVAAIMCNHLIRNRAVLLASRNHQAIDSILGRVNSLVDPHEIVLRLSRPWQQGASNALEQAVARLVSASNSSSADFNRSDNSLTDTLKRIDSLNEQIDNLSRDRKELIEILERIDVLATKLNSKLPGTYCFDPKLPLASSIREAQNSLSLVHQPKSMFSQLLARVLGKKSPTVSTLLAREIDAKYRAVFDLQHRLPQLPEDVTIEDLPKLVQLLSYWLPFADYNELAAKRESLEASFRTGTSLEELYNQHQAFTERMIAAVKERLLQCYRMVGASLSAEDRAQLTKLHQQLRNKQGWAEREDAASDLPAKDMPFGILQRHYPVMAVTNLSAKRNLPLQARLFELLVIDEASQCDVASVIPLLFRARRAVIVGDPMQLAHVTSLSHAVDGRLRQQFKVDSPELARFSYVDCSLFDLANNSPKLDARIELVQHHRCHPDIAAYCSRTFYHGRWIVLTNPGVEPAILWTDVCDDSKQAEGSGAISQTQIEKIADEVKRLEQSDFRGSLGIVTPFKQQANEILLRLTTEVSARFFERTRLVVETADGFQGDERDVILFSLVGGPQLPAGCKHFLANSPNRFNVAVSRAKSLIHVFGDADWASTCQISHIRELYLAYKQSQQVRTEGLKSTRRRDLIGPVWEPKFAVALEQAGISFDAQYPIAGRYLDFAIFHQGKKLNVEIDGEQFHTDDDGYRLEDDIARDQHLISLGWQVIRFWVFELRDDLPGCIRRVQAALSG